MNKDEIIELAKQAGFKKTTISNAWFKFAELVAEAERNECKKLCTWVTGNKFVDEAIAVCYRAIDQRGEQ